MQKEKDFLKSIGTQDIPHDTRTLYDHLVGVQELLAHHNRPDYEQRAGLFHAIYGTEFFPLRGRLNLTRENVRKNIGEQAEEIVYIFSQPEVRPFRIMGGIEYDEPLKTSLRWLDYCNGKEQHPDSDDLVLKNVMHLYETLLGI
jgi:hypothetical protein|tara:strand:- start:1671 stop:2102 length:432 start_codon:yes stop_codon:yes gene_type:complete